MQQKITMKMIFSCTMHRARFIQLGNSKQCPHNPTQTSAVGTDQFTIINLIQVKENNTLQLQQTCPVLRAN